MTETLAIYTTRRGLVAFHVKQHTSHDGRLTYSYEGKHGAGSGHALDHIRATIRLALSCHKGITLKSGMDILAPSFCQK